MKSAAGTLQGPRASCGLHGDGPCLAAHGINGRAELQETIFPFVCSSKQCTRAAVISVRSWKDAV